MVLQDRFEGIRRFLVHRHGHMRIPIQGDRDRRVPQDIGDDLRMHPLAQEQGSRRYASDRGSGSWEGRHVERGFATQPGLCCHPAECHVVR